MAAVRAALAALEHLGTGKAAPVPLESQLLLQAASATAANDECAMAALAQIEDALVRSEPPPKVWYRSA